MVAEVEVGQPELVRLAAFLRPVSLQEDGVDTVPARVVAVDTFNSQFKGGGMTKRKQRLSILLVISVESDVICLYQLLKQYQ